MYLFMILDNDDFVNPKIQKIQKSRFYHNVVPPKKINSYTNHADKKDDTV
jgi:hypothetical protein